MSELEGEWGRGAGVCTVHATGVSGVRVTHSGRGQEGCVGPPALVGVVFF